MTINQRAVHGFFAAKFCKPFLPSYRQPNAEVVEFVSASLNSYQALPRQLDLAHRLPFFPAASTRTDFDILAEFNFILHVRKGTWTVVREVDAGESVWA